MTDHLRVVPDNPGPEFKPRRFACLDRPTFCFDCHIEHCEYGQVPGASYVNFKDEVACLKIGCNWSVKAPDHDSALAAYERHLRDWHGGAA